MNPLNRRTFITRVLGTAAVTALPVGHVATALAANAEPEPFEVAPGMHVLDRHPYWNTVEIFSVDEDPRPHLDWSWDATGYVFIHDDQTDRATQRQIHLKGYVDGSMRIAITPTNPFDALHVGRGFVAVHLAPDLGAEIWKGLFARSDEDAPPIAPFTRPERDNYLAHQSRIGRMQRYCRTENDIEGPDEGVYRWFNFDRPNAA